MRFGLSLIVVALAAACASSTTSAPRACTPGSTEPCTCTDGYRGSQDCLTNGSGYGICTCSAPDAGRPVVSGEDAGDVDAGSDAFDPQKTLDVPCDPAHIPDTCPLLTSPGLSKQSACEQTHTPNTPHDEYSHCDFFCVNGSTPDNDAIALCHTLGGQCVAPVAGTTAQVCVPN